jgi:hypothetical protein
VLQNVVNQDWEVIHHSFNQSFDTFDINDESRISFSNKSLFHLILLLHRAYMHDEKEDEFVQKFKLEEEKFK